MYGQTTLFSCSLLDRVVHTVHEANALCDRQTLATGLYNYVLFASFKSYNVVLISYVGTRSHYCYSISDILK